MGNICFGTRKSAEYVETPTKAWSQGRKSSEASASAAKTPGVLAGGGAETASGEPPSSEALDPISIPGYTAADVTAIAKDGAPGAEWRKADENTVAADMAGALDAEALEEEEEVDEFADVEEVEWFDAAERGLTLTLRWHHKKGAVDVDQINNPQEKFTALHVCARHGHVDALRWLLDAKAEMVGDKTRRTPLHYAVNADIVKALLEHDAQPNGGDLWRKTPLHVAVEQGRLECVKCLLHATDLKKQDRDGDTVFHALARTANVELAAMIVAFVESCAGIRGTNNEGKSILDCVEDNEVGFLLVGAGCTFSKRKVDLAAAMECDEAYVVEYLLRHAPPKGTTSKANLLNPVGETPLSIAVRHNAQKACRVLLNHAVNVEVRTKGSTPAHLAASHGHAELLQLLLDANADVNAVDSLDRTCLYLSLAHGHKDIAAQLIQTHPQLIPVHDSGNRSIAHAAALGGIVLDNVMDVDDVSAFRPYEDWECWCPWHLAAMEGHLCVLQAMTLSDDELFVRVDFGLTVVHLATENGHADVLEYLKTRAACDPSIGRGSDGKNAWLIAAANDHLNCLQVLGPESIEDVDRDGRGALHVCGARSAQWLVDMGASLHLRDNIQWTPLHVQAAEGNLKVVDVLLKAKADVTLLDEEGQTARDCAVVRRQLHVLVSLDNARRND
eukprot:GEMP01032881.1.p1 GENE.GEMP01032881.1~~GEMP01032881.1.p1  ORF type:complete len:689 (+),score=191.90 GEMP01032881.1:54-2069(+)